MILWNIKRLFSAISRQAKPDREFVMALHKTLSEKGYLVPMRAPFATVWRRAAVSFACLLGLVVGTGTYAYASPEVLPDHPLYGLRSTIEEVELKVAHTPQAKEKVQLKQLRRHLKEQRLLVDKNQSLALVHARVVLKGLSEAAKSSEQRSLHASGEESGDEEGLQVIQAEEEADVRATVAMDREQLAEMADDQKELTEDEAVMFSQLLKERVERIEEHVDSLQKLRKTNRVLRR